MQNRALPKPQPTIWTSKTLWVLNSLIVLSAVAMFSALAVMFFSANSVSQKHAPLIQAIRQIELQATLAHLWCEEAASGDTSIRYEDIQSRMAESQRAAQLILEGGTSSLGKMKPLEASLLRDDIIEVQANLNQFQQITEQRWNNIQESGPGTEMDRQFDAVFNQFLSSTNKINDGLKQHIAADSRIFRTVSALLLAIACGVILTTAVLVNYFLADQYKTKHKLLAFNQQLQANEQQLRAANQQLRADEQQLKADEAELESLAKFPSENPYPVLRIQDDGTIIYHNEASRSLLGQWQCTLGQTLPSPWLDIVKQAVVSEKPAQAEIRCDSRVFSLTFAPVSKRNYVNVYAVDITARKRAERQLLAREQQLQSINQELRASQQQQDASNQQLRASNQQLQANEQQLKAAGLQLQAANQQLRASETQLKAYVEQLQTANQRLSDSENRYRSLFENMMNGFALHEIVLDQDGQPVDYVFLEVNDAFERLAHLKQENIVGKRVSEILPGIKEDPAQWIDRYGQVALTGQELQFEEYSEDLGKWFSILAFSPRKGQFATIFEDITEKKNAEEALQKSEEYFRLVYEQLPLGYQSLDEEGRFIEVNPMWLSMMGYEKQEVLGKSFADFLPENSRHLFMERFPRFKAAEEVRSVNFKLIRKDGALVDVEIDGKIGRHPGGSFKQTHCVLNDITERKKAEREREKLMRMIESKNEELQSIVYVSSHDLKTPLVNISGFGKLLQKHCGQLKEILQNKAIDSTVSNALRELLDEDIPEDLGFIIQSARKMDSLINGLLEVARAGTASLNTTHLDMNRIICGIIDNAAFKAQEMEAQITADALAPCIADPSQVSQAFMNLIDNSLKYAHSSRKPRIHISCTTRDGESIYCVEDNGIGIPPEHHEKIFEIFHRLNPKSDTDGEGLGLTIIRRIIDRHSGKIWLESTPEEGSKFYISLPNKEIL